MFSLKNPLEVITLKFDFTALTAAVSAPVVSVTVASGTPDPSAASVLLGVPQVSGAVVYQQVTGGVSGSYYEFQCLITAADGTSKFLLLETLPCIAT